MNVIPKADVTELDALIDVVSAPGESQCELLREHLESARQYLLGSMPTEYGLSLQLAHQALNCISSEERRTRVKSMLDDLLASTK